MSADKPVFKLQRFRGGWAIASYVGGKRVSRRKLDAVEPAAAGREFDAVVAAATKPERPKVSAIWDAFAEARAGRPIATTMGFERKAVLAHFGSHHADEITEQLCRDYMQVRADAGRKPGTIWTELGHLRTALKWAADSGRIDRAPKIVRPEKPDPKSRYLTKVEAERLLAGATMPHVRLFIVLAITTAGRAGAILDLTWDRCDFDRGTIQLSTDELGARRRKGRATTPMNDMARAALAEASAGARTDYVIEWAGQKVAKIRRGIETAATKAKLEEVTPHVLRHTAAVWMAEAGVPMSEIAQYLGHADSRITERVYARYSPEHLRRAAGALNFGGLKVVR